MMSKPLNIIPTVEMPDVTEATPSQISEQISRLFSGLKSWSGSDEDSILKFHTYKDCLTGFPIFLIERAITAFLDGEVAGQSDRYVPSTAELKKEIKRIGENEKARLWLSQQPEPRRLPEPEPISMEERKRVGDKLKKLAEELKGRALSERDRATPKGWFI